MTGRRRQQIQTYSKRRSMCSQTWASSQRHCRLVSCPPVKSTDNTPPASGISSPANGASFTTGQPVLISGFASDIGGRVAGVEVSVDGGVTWHRASGTTSWTYTWTATAGTYTIESRATDDSLNTETPSASGPGISVTPAGSTLFSAGQWSRIA